MNLQTTAMRREQIQLSTGLRLSYTESGNPDGPPVILLHGLSDSWFSYSLVLPALGANFRLYALDQRGHGDSERPPDGYRMTNFADDVVAFLDVMGIEQASIIGHSMGSAVAITTALAAPTRVSALVLVGAMHRWNTPEVLGFQEELVGLGDEIPTPFVQAFQESTALQPLAAPFLERVVTESLKLPAYVWRQSLAGQVGADYAGRLGDIRMPVLVIGGEEDGFCTAADQKCLASMLPNAELKLYPQTGHCPHWEHPDTFVKDVKAFLRTVTRS